MNRCAVQSSTVLLETITFTPSFESSVSRLIEELIKSCVNKKAIKVGAEEDNRLDISLNIFELIFIDKVFEIWKGLGLAIQAYQKWAFI